jgi:hypothetical protein
LGPGAGKRVARVIDIVTTRSYLGVRASAKKVQWWYFAAHALQPHPTARR